MKRTIAALMLGSALALGACGGSHAAPAIVTPTDPWDPNDCALSCPAPSYVPEPTIAPAVVVTTTSATPKPKAKAAKTTKPKPRPVATTEATSAPEGGPYTCVDGSVSHAKHRQGACSHHGGIA